MAGARVLIIGGRQSAYEWAALLREHGAARIDIVHRHDVPRFERVSWKFADVHVERTLNVPGILAQPPGKRTGRDRQALLGSGPAHPRVLADSPAGLGGDHPAARNRGRRGGAGRRRRGAGAALRRFAADRGPRGVRVGLPRRSRQGRVSRGRARQVETRNGFPVLDESFQTSLAGLYVTGFSATQDFGPFFGFVKGSPAAATLVVRDLLSAR